MKTYTKETFPGCDTCKWCINVGNELHPSLYCKNIKFVMGIILFCVFMICVLIRNADELDRLEKETKMIRGDIYGVKVYNQCLTKDNVEQLN